MNSSNVQQNSKFPWLILKFPDFSLTSGNPVCVNVASLFEQSAADIYHLFEDDFKDHPVHHYETCSKDCKIIQSKSSGKDKFSHKWLFDSQLRFVNNLGYGG